MLKENCLISLCASSQQLSFHFNQKNSLATRDFNLLNISKISKSILLGFQWHWYESPCQTSRFSASVVIEVQFLSFCPDMHPSFLLCYLFLTTSVSKIYQIPSKVQNKWNRRILKIEYIGIAHLFQKPYVHTYKTMICYGCNPIRLWWNKTIDLLLFINRSTDISHDNHIFWFCVDFFY